MKWPFNIGNQLRVSIVLTIIVGLVIISNLVLRRDIDDIDRSFTSIYNDRLMPAADVFYITEHLYKKRMAVEKNALAPHPDVEVFEKMLHTFDMKIDSLTSEIEKTYLVQGEGSLLKEFNARRTAYNNLEQQAIDLTYANDTDKAMALLENEAADSFDAMLKDLHQLTLLQSTTGKELLAESHHIKASASMLSFLEVGAAIVLGVLVHVMLLSSQVVRRRSDQPFHLN